MCCSCEAAVKAQSACSFWACLKNHSFGDGSTHSRSDGGPSGSQAVTASGVRCLQAIAQVLQVSVSFFFEEANPSGGESAKLAAIAEALRAKAEGKQKTILFNLSGHGHFDMQSYIAYQAGQLENYDYPEEEIAMALAGLPAFE